MQLVEQTLTSDGWKVVEQFFKDELAAEYCALETVKPENLQLQQLRINTYKNFLRTVYSLAGWDWTWDGYRDIREQITEELTEEQIKLRNYLKTVSGGEI